MKRRPTWTDIAVASAIVLAVVVAGLGLARLPGSPATWSIEMPADSGTLQRWSVVAASTVGPLGARLHPLTGRVTTVLEHAPEVLLVFELGLLVEHLRLLHRVSDALPGRADAGPSRERHPPEQARR